MNWNPAADGPPRGWLESVGAIYRATYPSGPSLRALISHLEKVHVEYGTLLRRVNYREVGCKKTVSHLSCRITDWLPRLPGSG
ncbi:hypothetical protein JCM18918_2050 [Cutibacterium acnes JCM 18918]|nr:hypothetical protein JCM18918_2050 [Cutibacterium acnes JCM 18918]